MKERGRVKGGGERKRVEREGGNKGERERERESKLKGRGREMSAILS